MSDSHEKLESSAAPSSSDKPQSGPKLSGNEKVKQGAESVLGAANEGGDSAEDGGEVMGNVSESSSEDKKGPAGGKTGGAKAMTADEIEQLKAKLLANAPAQGVMLSEIRKTLIREEKQLHHEFSSLAANPQKNPSRFVEIVSRMRAINAHFESMINATYEFVKHMWLKIVHKI